MSEATATVRISDTIIQHGANILLGEPGKPVLIYRLELVQPRAGSQYRDSAIFAKLATNAGDQYLGRLDEFTGQVMPTRATKPDYISCRQLVVLNRALARIWADDEQAIIDSGWTLDIIPHGQPQQPQLIKQMSRYGKPVFVVQKFEGGQQTGSFEFDTKEGAEEFMRSGGYHIPKRDQRGALDFIADSFTLACGYGLKRPMIRAHYRGQRFKFYLSARGTVCLKSGKLSAPAEDGSRDPVGEEEYVGCLCRGRFLQAQVGFSPDYYGRPWSGNRPLRPLTEAEREFLDKLASDPVNFLAQCSKDMCRCCYCYSALEDQRSKEVGYGPVCATRWGLPWGKARKNEAVPSFARSYNDTAHDLMATIRSNRTDELAWNVFGDWLEEHGLPRCTMPDASVHLPRND